MESITTGVALRATADVDPIAKELYRGYLQTAARLRHYIEEAESNLNRLHLTLIDFKGIGDFHQQVAQALLVRGASIAKLAEYVADCQAWAGDLALLAAESAAWANKLAEIVNPKRRSANENTPAQEAAK